MPIPIDQFEKGLDSTDLRIIGLLKSSPSAAYSIDEIAKAIGEDSAMVDWAARITFSVRLSRLVNKKRIRSSGVGNTTYYAALQRKTAI